MADKKERDDRVQWRSTESLMTMLGKLNTAERARVLWLLPCNLPEDVMLNILAEVLSDEQRQRLAAHKRPMPSDVDGSLH